MGVEDPDDLSSAEVSEEQQRDIDARTHERRAEFRRRAIAFHSLVWPAVAFYVGLASTLIASFFCGVGLYDCDFEPRRAELIVLSTIPTTLLLAAARMAATARRQDVTPGDGSITDAARALATAAEWLRRSQ